MGSKTMLAVLLAAAVLFAGCASTSSTIVSYDAVVGGVGKAQIRVGDHVVDARASAVVEVGDPTLQTLPAPKPRWCAIISLCGLPPLSFGDAAMISKCQSIEAAAGPVACPASVSTVDSRNAGSH